jgi:hypothetical protein
MTKKVVGKRTYLSALAIILHQILNQMGLKDITGDQISIFIDVGLALFAMLFRYLAERRVKK